MKLSEVKIGRALLEAVSPAPWTEDAGNIYATVQTVGIEPGCCGNFRRSGECCGDAVQVPFADIETVRIAGAEPAVAALLLWLGNNAGELLDIAELCAPDEDEPEFKEPF